MAESVYWWIAIVGSIASILSAIWAWIQALSARNAATDAKKYRDEVVNRRELLENSQIHKETKKIQSILLALGPRCTTQTVRGIDCKDVAEQVLRYASLLREHSANFPDALKTEINSFGNEVKPLIERLSLAKKFEEKRSSGSEIYYLVEGLLSEIKSATDDKKEQ